VRYTILTGLLILCACRHEPQIVVPIHYEPPYHKWNGGTGYMDWCNGPSVCHVEYVSDEDAKDAFLRMAFQRRASEVCQERHFTSFTADPRIEHAYEDTPERFGFIGRIGGARGRSVTTSSISSETQIGPS
jgi:hypothetical protein